MSSSSSCSKERIDIEFEDCKYSFQGYICQLSVNAFHSIQQTNQKKSSSSFVYDQIFRMKSNYNPQIHRDDRQHSKFLQLNQQKQEKEKSIPSRSSSEYGRQHQHQHQSMIDTNDRSYLKIDHLKKDFYRNNGVQFQ